MSEQLHGWIGSPATATSLRALSKALLISLFLHAALLGAAWRIISINPPPPPREILVELSTNAIPASATTAAQVAPPPLPDRAERKSPGRADRIAPRAQASNVQAVAPAPAAAAAPDANPPAAPAEVALEGEQQQAQAEAPSVPIDLRVLDWLAQYRSYPLAARRAGIEGVVQLRVTLLPDGRLVDARIERSSGHALLDRAAIDLLTRAARLPEEFGSTRTEQIELQLPIVYRMRT